MTIASDQFFKDAEGGFGSYTAGELSGVLAANSEYKVIVCAEMCAPPSPWTDEIKVDVDHEKKVVRLIVELV